MIELEIIDSAPATKEHIAEVQKNIETVCSKLYKVIAEMNKHPSTINPYVEHSIDR